MVSHVGRDAGVHKSPDYGPPLSRKTNELGKSLGRKTSCFRDNGAASASLPANRSTMATNVLSKPRRSGRVLMPFRAVRSAPCEPRGAFRSVRSARCVPLRAFRAVRSPRCVPLGAFPSVRSARCEPSVTSICSTGPMARALPSRRLRNLQASASGLGTVAVAWAVD